MKEVPNFFQISVSVPRQLAAASTGRDCYFGLTYPPAIFWALARQEQAERVNGGALGTLCGQACGQRPEPTTLRRRKPMI
jgi:hypothetical protein